MRILWANKVREQLADICIDCMSREAMDELRLSTNERKILQRKIRDAIGFIDEKLAKRNKAK